MKTFNYWRKKFEQKSNNKMGKRSFREMEGKMRNAYHRPHTHTLTHGHIDLAKTVGIPTCIEIKRFSLWKWDNDMILRLPTICVSFHSIFFAAT